MASLLDLKARLKEVNELVELGVDGLEVDRALLKEQIKELWLSENQGVAAAPVKAPALVSPPRPRAAPPPPPPVAVVPPPPAAPVAAVAPAVVFHKRPLPELMEKNKKKKLLRSSLAGQLKVTSFYAKQTTVFNGASASRAKVATTTCAPVREVALNATFKQKCSKCNLEFSNAGAKATHEKTCGERAAAAAAKKKRVEKRKAAEQREGSLDSEATEERDVEGSPAAAPKPAQKAPRLTKTGVPDRRALNKGAASRKRYSAIFKLTVCEKINVLKAELGDDAGAARLVARQYGLAYTAVYPWMKDEEKLRKLLTTDKHAGGKYDAARKLANSKDGRRMSLGSCRSALYPIAEKVTYDLFRKRREKGLRIGPRLLRAMMRVEVKGAYGPEPAALFKASKSWLYSFARRWGLSLRKRNNGKAVSAEERLPKIQRYLARFRRRLRRGPAGEAAVALLKAAKDEAALVSSSHRGLDGKPMVAHQQDHGLANDCGLCALKNATGNANIYIDDVLEIANRFESALKAEEAASGVKSSVRHVDETGNFSGAVLVAVAEANNYAAYRLSKEQDGECGHARALVETLCLLANARVCGVVWRLGGAIGAATSSGHWVAASHIPSIRDWRTHQWFFKDSLRNDAVAKSTEEILLELDTAERRRADFYVIVDLA